MAEKAESMRNLALTAQLYEQATKECGDRYVNRARKEEPDDEPLIPTRIQVDVVDVRKQLMPALKMRYDLRPIGKRSKGMIGRLCAKFRIQYVPCETRTDVCCWVEQPAPQSLDFRGL